jgi:hypothetical protein
MNTALDFEMHRFPRDRRWSNRDAGMKFFYRPRPYLILTGKRGNK